MSFPAHKIYRQSGIAWAESLPEKWDTARLKNIFQLMKRSPEDGDEIITAFRDGQVTLRSNRRVDGFTNAEQEHGYQRILPKDLVIHAMDAFAGAIGVSDSTGKSTPVYSVCRQKDPRTNVFYYGYLLRHMALSGFVNSLAKGIRERSTEFRWKDASNVLLPIPPFDEQRAIAAFLDAETSKIDALVAEKRRLIELLKEKRQAVISHAVTKGLNPHVKMKPSGIDWLGDVPEHWEVAPIKHLVLPKKGAIKTGPFGSQLISSEMQSGAIKVYNQRNVIDCDFVTGDNYITEDKFMELATFEVHSGDLLITTRGTIGRAAIFPEKADRGILHPCLLRIQADDLRIDTLFLKILIQDSHLMKTQLSYLSNSTTIDVIYSNTIASIIIPVPPRKEQAEILEFLDSELDKFAAMIDDIERAVALLQERRTALISAAVTGKIDVRDFVAKDVSA